MEKKQQSNPLNAGGREVLIRKKFDEVSAILFGENLSVGEIGQILQSISQNLNNTRINIIKKESSEKK